MMTIFTMDVNYSCPIIYIYIYIYVGVCSYIHAYTRIYLHIYIYIYIPYLHSYPYTHTHTNTLFLPCSHKKNKPNIYLSCSRTVRCREQVFVKLNHMAKGVFQRGYLSFFVKIEWMSQLTDININKLKSTFLHLIVTKINVSWGEA